MKAKLLAISLVCAAGIGAIVTQLPSVTPAPPPAPAEASIPPLAEADPANFVSSWAPTDLEFTTPKGTYRSMAPDSVRCAYVACDTDAVQVRSGSLAELVNAEQPLAARSGQAPILPANQVLHHGDAECQVNADESVACRVTPGGGFSISSGGLVL